MRGSGFLPLLRLTQGEMLATAVVRAREGRAKPEGLEAKGGPTLPTLVSVDGNSAHQGPSPSSLTITETSNGPGGQRYHFGDADEERPTKGEHLAHSHTAPKGQSSDRTLATQTGALVDYSLHP